LLLSQPGAPGFHAAPALPFLASLTALKYAHPAVRCLATPTAGRQVLPFLAALFMRGRPHLSTIFASTPKTATHSPLFRSRLLRSVGCRSFSRSSAVGRQEKQNFLAAVFYALVEVRQVADFLTPRPDTSIVRGTRAARRSVRGAIRSAVRDSPSWRPFLCARPKSALQDAPGRARAGLLDLGGRGF
jgi:hypothetical protein